MTKGFCWVDLETTGLNPISDSILEIGMIITDFRLNELAVIHRLVPLPDHRNFQNIEEIVVNMHTDSGLWTSLENATNANPIGVTDMELAAVLQLEFNAFGFDQVMLAGNTVHFDKGFIDVQMPKTASLFHYRVFDCRTLMTFAEMCGMDYEVEKVQPEHRSMNDIRTSLNFMKKFYMPWEENRARAEHVAKIL